MFYIYSLFIYFLIFNSLLSCFCWFSYNFLAILLLQVLSSFFIITWFSFVFSLVLLYIHSLLDHFLTSNCYEFVLVDFLIVSLISFLYKFMSSFSNWIQYIKEIFNKFLLRKIKKKYIEDLLNSRVLNSNLRIEEIMVKKMKKHYKNYWQYLTPEKEILFYISTNPVCYWRKSRDDGEFFD